MLWVALTLLAGPFGDDPWAGCELDIARDRVSVFCGSVTLERQKRRSSTDAIQTLALWGAEGGKAAEKPTPPALGHVDIVVMPDGHERALSTTSKHLITCEAFNVDDCFTRLAGLRDDAPIDAQLDGQHPLTLFGHSFWPGTCDIDVDDDRGVARCGRDLLIVQSAHRDAEPFFAFDLIASRAEDVDCTFLGVNRTCRAMVSRPAPSKFQYKKPDTPLNADLNVWTVEDDTLVVCSGSGPTVAPACASLFHNVASSGAAAPAPKGPRIDGARVLARCQLSTAGDKDALACGDFDVTIERTIPEVDTPPPRAKKVATLARRSAWLAVDIEKGWRVVRGVLTHAPPFSCRGRPGVADLDLLCLEVASHFIETDTRPRQHVFAGIPYTVPEGCTATLNNVSCPDGALLLQRRDTPLPLSELPGVMGLVRGTPERREELPCSLGPTRGTCAVLRYRTAPQSVVFGNGPGWVATCISTSSEALPQVCSPFVRWAPSAPAPAR
jgi:hypothetical protein